MSGITPSGSSYRECLGNLKPGAKIGAKFGAKIVIEVILVAAAAKATAVVAIKAPPLALVAGPALGYSARFLANQSITVISPHIDSSVDATCTGTQAGLDCSAQSFLSCSRFFGRS